MTIRRWLWTQRYVPLMAIVSLATINLVSAAIDSDIAGDMSIAFIVGMVAALIADFVRNT